MIEFKTVLFSERPCQEAVNWVKSRDTLDPVSLWEACPRGDWLIWACTFSMKDFFIYDENGLFNIAWSIVEMSLEVRKEELLTVESEQSAFRPIKAYFERFLKNKNLKNLMYLCSYFADYADFSGKKDIYLEKLAEVVRDNIFLKEKAEDFRGKPIRGEMRNDIIEILEDTWSVSQYEMGKNYFVIEFRYDVDDESGEVREIIEKINYYYRDEKFVFEQIVEKNWKVILVEN